jgi:phage shock protein C
MNRFYRSKENSYVGGVCGGLGEYTNIDPILWRLLFIFIPSGLYIYLIMWAFTKSK